MTRIEDMLGIEDAGTTALDDTSSDAAARDAAVVGGDRAAPCALAKVASYQAWQEALLKAKASANGAAGAGAASSESVDNASHGFIGSSSCLGAHRAVMRASPASCCSMPDAATGKPRSTS